MKATTKKICSTKNSIQIFNNQQKAIKNSLEVSINQRLLYLKIVESFPAEKNC